MSSLRRIATLPVSSDSATLSKPSAWALAMVSVLDRSSFQLALFFKSPLSRLAPFLRPGKNADARRRVMVRGDNSGSLSSHIERSTWSGRSSRCNTAAYIESLPRRGARGTLIFTPAATRDRLRRTFVPAELELRHFCQVRRRSALRAARPVLWVDTPPNNCSFAPLRGVFGRAPGPRIPAAGRLGEPCACGSPPPIGRLRGNKCVAGKKSLGTHARQQAGRLPHLRRWLIRP